MLLKHGSMWWDKVKGRSGVWGLSRPLDHVKTFNKGMKSYNHIIFFGKLTMGGGKITLI